MLQWHFVIQSVPSFATMSTTPVPVPTVKFTQLFYYGQFCDSKSKQTFASVNPYTGKVVANIQEANLEDVDAAVKLAGKAFTEWRKLDASRRGRLLTRLGDLIEENLTTIAVSVWIKKIQTLKLDNICII